MKRIFGTIILLFTLSHLAHGQACGMYKIQYIGKISSNKQIKAVYLPTTSYLDGSIDFDDKDAFKEASIINNQFETVLWSRLGTVYQNEQHILSAYQSKHKGFKIQVEWIEYGLLKETIIELDWKDILIIKQKDSTMPTFLFDLKTIRL
jgi:hypothetical protein